MSDIIYNASKIKEFENLMALCEIAGEERCFGELLWEELLWDTDLYEEYVYYITNHKLEGKVIFAGYTLLDLYVWQMGHSNLTHDTGKNTEDFCNKESMVLRAFRMMLDMKKNPEEYIRKLSEDRGMDRY